MPALKHVLQSIDGVPSELIEDVSERWQCDIVTDESNGDRIATAIAEEQPVLCDKSLAAAVHTECGSDGLAFVAQYDGFPKPKICMRSGWGAPGSVVTGDDHVDLVSSFTDVVQPSSPAEPPRNLQMFHRPGSDADPGLPVLAQHLHWPLLSPFLSTSEGGVIVDSATRVSKRGAVTWWHLDDCGEFTFQSALPQVSQAQASENGSENPIVKVFIFAGKEAYDFITQDEVTNRKGTFAQLDPFNTPSFALPPVLPRLWVALLRAGGEPLLSPPNLPHLVITTQDCVMVEQRRLSRFFLDESWYFAERTRNWQHRPIAYDFIEKTLKNKATCMDDTVRYLCKQLELWALDSQCYSRAIASLRALAEANFAPITTDDLPLKAQQLDFGNCSPHMPDMRFCRNVTLVRFMQQAQPARGVLRLPQQCQRSEFRIHSDTLCSDNHGETCTECLGPCTYVAYVHIGGRPHFGPMRESIESATADRKALQQAAVQNCLHDTHKAMQTS